MDALRTLLPRVLHKRGLHAQAKASQITYAAEVWLHRALPHLAQMIQVEKLQYATLSICCTHGIAAQECQPLLPMLRTFLCKEFSEKSVAEIRMVRAR